MGPAPYLILRDFK